VNEPPRPAEAVRAALTAGLREAMKAREQVAVETLRSLLSALDNASAVPLPAGVDAYGSGPTEAARHDATLDEIIALFAAEQAEREGAEANYRRLGLEAEADRLAAQLAVIARFWPAGD
jgi:uncharacterized protein YqeY